MGDWGSNLPALSSLPSLLGNERKKSANATRSGNNNNNHTGFSFPWFPTLSQTCAAGVSFYAGVSCFQFVGLRLNVSSVSPFTSSFLGLVGVACSSALAFKSATTLKKFQGTPQSPANSSSKKNDILFHSLLGIFAFKLLGGQFCNLMPSHLRYPGSNSKVSIPTRGSNYANVAETEKLQNLFARYGCHHCGKKTGKLIADHMPPNKEAIKLQNIISKLVSSPSFSSLSYRSDPWWRFSKSNNSISALSSTQSLAAFSISAYASIIFNESTKRSLESKKKEEPIFQDTRNALDKFFDRFLPICSKLDQHGIGWKLENKNAVVIMQRFFPQCIECCKKQSSAVRNAKQVLVMHRPHGLPEPFYFTGLCVGGSSFISQRKDEPFKKSHFNHTQLIS